MTYNITPLKNISKFNQENYNKSMNWEYVNYLDTGNITENKVDNVQLIDLKSDKLPSRARRIPQKNSILYSTVRPNQKHYGFVRENNISNLLVSTGFIVLDVDKNKAHPKYIYYYLIQDSVINMLQNIGETSTSTYPSIKVSDLENLKINLPTIFEQEKIANVLSSFDNKIENNNAIIANLEEQAQAVFKETLNNYNFTQVKLNTLIDIYSGFAFKSKDYLPGGTHKIITIKNIEDGKINETNVNKIDNIPDNIKDEAFLRIGDIVFSMTGNVGRTALIYKKGLLLNQRVGKILFDNTDYISFYYFLFRNISFKQRLIDLAHGTAQANLGKMDTLNLEIPYNKKAMDNFSDIFNPVVNKIINLMRQNDKLIEVRETLLPKLMSGELRVEDTVEAE